MIISSFSCPRLIDIHPLFFRVLTALPIAVKVLERIGRAQIMKYLVK